MAISREEFDKLAARVDRIERTRAARIEMMSAEIVGLRTHLDERFDGVDRRLDGVDGRLEGVDGRLDGIDGRLDGIDGRLEGIDGRLEGVDGRLDEQARTLETYTEQVMVAIRQGSEAAARQERFARAIADHFGIELGES